jgi:hypothetical protein
MKILNTVKNALAATGAVLFGLTIGLILVLLCIPFILLRVVLSVIRAGLNFIIDCVDNFLHPKSKNPPAPPTPGMKITEVS